MTEPSPILTELQALFGEVMRAVTGDRAGQYAEGGLNAKGDRVKWFDLAADEAIHEFVEKQFPYPVRLWSEEGAPRGPAGGESEFTMVVDPVDGSDNFSRGIAPAGVAIALIPSGLPVSVATVQFALVGDLYTGSTLVATRGGGAYVDGRRIESRPAVRLEEAIISCELNHFAIGSPLASVLARAGGVRVFGCATRALTMVATGAVAAHLDLRDRLTPENFLAPSLIVTEAGGIVTDRKGRSLPEISELTERYSILAATTPELHRDLVLELAGETLNDG